MRHHVSLTLLLGLTALLWTETTARAQNAACYDYLNRDTYTTGFSSSDFEGTTDMNIVSGNLVLDTDERRLGDSNRISVNTRQKLSAHYVYESAGASHTFGVFVWDSTIQQFVQPNGYNFTQTPCASNADCDPGMECRSDGTQNVCAYPKYVLRDDGVGNGWANNKAYDWFETLYLKSCSTCTPYLLSSPYSDGGTYAHVPNLLESLSTTQGAWIFKLADDDTDYSEWGGLPPVNDHSPTKNGVPDYDVNGDGTIDVNDRSVDLGTFDAGSELVFYLVVYYNQTVRKSTMGIGGYDSCGWAPTCDYGCPSSGQTCEWCAWRCGTRNGGHYRWHDCSWWERQQCSSCVARGWNYTCKKVEDTSSTSSRIIPYFSKRVLNPDYKDSGNGYYDRDIGCPYGSTCNGYGGWVDQAALNRLQNIYGLTMPHEIKRIHYRMDGQSDHVFVGAPSTEPNWWILGFEDLYDHGDRDFNDLVFLVFRTNGGESVSNVITDEMSAQEKAQSTITKVRFQKNDHIPIPPCSSDPDKVRIEYYVAIDTDSNGDPNWILVQFPPTSPDEVVLDMQELGVAGTELRWKAVIISDDHDCKPEIRDVNVGYEALKSGEYLFSSPLLLANALYRGGLETRSTSWTVTGNDYSNRGHFRMYELYEPETPDQLVKTPIWDAGERLAGRDPDSRTIWTNNAGNTEQISASASNWVLSNVLSPAARAEKLNSKPVYDLDADGDSDDDDARRIIQWTRGWESPGVARAWKLGPIHKSTAAVVHLPGEPEWLNKTGVIPSQARTEYVSWAGSSAMTERDTVAYVGAQDGMLHAFDAGSFRWGDNPHTNTVEHRGYFQYDQSAQAFEYGSGEELWAFVPPSQLGNLKNNKLRNYYPEVNAPAMVDGSVVVSDVYGVFPFSGLTSKAWRTAIFFTLGTQQPYLSALDVTNPQSPRPLWTDDWTDVDFQGTSAAPTVHWIEARVSGGADPTWGLALSSGLATTPADVFLYLLDVPTGNTLRKVQLNQGSGTAGSQAYGVAGRPVLVDRDDDGVADRVYVADTNGRIWRHNLDSQNSANACLLAEVGQPIYHTPGVIVREDSTSKPLVALYFGTGDDPRQDDTPNAPYWIYAMVDEDETAAQCTPASLLYKYQLPSDEKVWGDPSIAAERVYFGTSTGDKAHLCDEDTTNPGHVYTFELDPTSPGVPSQPESPVSAGGNVVSGLMVYDQHVVLNTVGGQTTLIGGSTWNNLSGLVSSPQMKDVYWNEVLNK